jgi:hypothetical protein
METWIMVRAKRARTAERPTQPSLDLRSRAPWFYPDPSPDYSPVFGCKARRTAPSAVFSPRGARRTVKYACAPLGSEASDHITGELIPIRALLEFDR